MANEAHHVRARLHPRARQLIEDSAASGRPNAHFLTVHEARANFDADFAALGPGEPVVAVTDLVAPGDAGDVHVRVYRPSAAESLPVVMYFHGGGWLLGSLDSHDYACRRLANASGAIVVSVGYRLAPEHRFPAAVHDCVAATRWAHANAADLGGDGTRLALAGDSAGGNLALAVALTARAEGRPAVRFLLLVYPVTTTRLDTETFDDRYERVMLWRDELAWHQSNYLADDRDRRHPLVAPLDAADLAGLPDTMVLLAECDPIRPQGEALVAKLSAAGVRVESKTYEGMIHGFFGLSEVFDGAPDGIDDAAAALRRALDNRPLGEGARR